MKRSRNELNHHIQALKFDETSEYELSPISHLSYNLSSILSSDSVPKRRVTVSANSPCHTPIKANKENIQGSESPVSFDSPMFDEGVLKENCGNVINRPKGRTLSRFRSLQVTSTVVSPPLQRSYSDTEASIMMAVQKSDQDPNLVGDFSKAYSLPLMKGKHQDIKAISPETLRKVLRGEFDHVVDSYKIIDCRYPYEYEGGHIMGAKNIYTEEGITDEFLTDCAKPIQKENCNILIFHCEFSSERGPKLYRYLRNQDRKMNKDNYPLLFYPEIYLLDGGYKAFFEASKEFCEPKQYRPMNHKDHGNDLRHFRAKSKSWTGDAKMKVLVRSGLKF